MTLDELRGIMGREVWDTIGEETFPPSFIEAYDSVVELLYGGDHPGETVDVTDGSKKADSKWPLKDTRVLPLKVWADTFCTCAARLLCGNRPLRPGVRIKSGQALGVYGRVPQAPELPVKYGKYTTRKKHRVRKDLNRLADWMWWHLANIGAVPIHLEAEEPTDGR